jgi:monofunctional biosynthetic peptidoglycan transglycosylase
MTRLGRLVGLLALAVVSLQLYFVARIALMNAVDPASTTFQRSEARRILGQQGQQSQLAWSQTWVPLTAIGPNLPRAVIASEDAGFAEHGGIDWDAVQSAWDKNQRAQQRVQQRGATRPPKVVGGSTLTQQLAKNLFLSGERTLLRKAQEAALTLALEALLSKRRLLELYLNHVEWGEGVFGAEAAARHYFRVPARQLSAPQAARLAVMLPAPKRFERLPQSPYLAGRSATILARMGAVQVP